MSRSNLPAPSSPSSIAARPIPSSPVVRAEIALAEHRAEMLAQGEVILMLERLTKGAPDYARKAMSDATEAAYSILANEAELYRERADALFDARLAAVGLD